jgi:pimeloyl-ACP methyl ester carboxylesterase
MSKGSRFFQLRGGKRKMIIEPRFADAISARSIAVNGARSEVLTGGGGPPLLLLHGDGDTPASWQWVFAALARDFRVVAPSLPGHTHSDKLKEEYTIGGMTAFMSSYLDSLELDRCIIVGNSLGGLLAIHLALAEPGRFQALILVDSSGLGREIHPLIALMSLPGIGELGIALARSPFGPGQRAVGRLTQMFARFDRAPAAWLAEQRRVAKVPGFLEASLAATRAGIRPWGQTEVVLDELNRLTMPTLVLWGANDAVVPASHARRAMSRLPNAKLALIPHCGHLPHVERPSEFLSAVVPFAQRSAKL